MTSVRWYSLEELYSAWELMVAAGTELSSKAFLYDLVDITRQALVNTGSAKDEIDPKF